MGLPALEAIEKLRFVPQKAALPIRKLIAGAVAAAQNNFNLKAEDLVIVHLTADKGPSFRRYLMRGRGRADRIMKPTAHLKVILSDKVISSSKEVPKTSPPEGKVAPFLEHPIRGKRKIASKKTSSKEF